MCVCVCGRHGVRSTVYSIAETISEMTPPARSAAAHENQYDASLLLTTSTLFESNKPPTSPQTKSLHAAESLSKS